MSPVGSPLFRATGAEHTALGLTTRRHAIETERDQCVSARLSPRRLHLRFVS